MALRGLPHRIVTSLRDSSANWEWLYTHGTSADDVAGAGLTETDGVLAVGEGHGIDVAADAVAVDETELDGTLIPGAAEETPLTIENGTTYTVPTDVQTLFAEAIDVVGVLDVQGSLIDVSQSPAMDHGLVTVLPNSPVTGDRCTYVDSLAAPTYRWCFQYNGSSGYWEFIGGTPLSGSDADSRSTTSTSYAPLATDPFTLTIPLTGDYLITCSAALTAAASNFGYYSYTVGAVAASDAWAVHVAAAGVQVWATPAKTTLHTSVPQSAVVTEQSRSSVGGSISTGDRRIFVQPTRVLA